MRSRDYWRQRSEAVQELLMREAEESTEAVERIFSEADRAMQGEVLKWFARFAENNEISLPDAKRLLNSDELEEFRWTVEEYLKRAEENGLDAAWTKQLENASARYHVSRLEALRTQLRQYVEVTCGRELQTLETLLSDTYAEGYNRTLFTLGQGIGASVSFQKFDESALAKILKRPWTTDGKTFRDRCWTNKTALIESLQKTLTQGIIAGTDPRTLTKQMSRAMNASAYKARRLVMTESAYFAAEARRDCFKALEVERYEIIGTLDTSTCSTCGDLDGHVFRQADYEPGVTAPPFHPNCRCTTAPYFDDMVDVGKRYARDAKTGERYKLPKEITYNEWKAMQNTAYGSGIVDKLQKIGYNESADRSQFERYKEWLGSNAPKTFEDFQKLKYSDDWKPFKAYTRAIKSGELTPLADFKLYKEISNGITITGKSYHFIARTIGSVEQRRNGVSIAKALDTITHPERVELIRINENGKSQRFIGKTAAVTINPDTGMLIQSNPIHKSKKAKEVTP